MDGAPTFTTDAAEARRLERHIQGAGLLGRLSLLFLGEVTIKTYVGNILMKLGCRDRVQAVVAAYEAGVVEPAITANSTARLG